MSDMPGVEDGAKYCPDCRTDKSLTEFTRDARRKDGLSFYCRPCRILRDERSRHKRNGTPGKRIQPREVSVPDGHKWCPECQLVKSFDEFPTNRAAQSGYMTYCKPCFAGIVERNRAKHHGSSRNYHLKRRYGITAEEADVMFAEQQGLCAICCEAPAEHVDHDHATGRVRGLLCFNCNGALGQFRDRRDLMLRAIAYLGRDDVTAMRDLPQFGVGLYLGPTDTGRPADEPDEPEAA